MRTRFRHADLQAQGVLKCICLESNTPDNYLSAVPSTIYYLQTNKVKKKKQSEKVLGEVSAESNYARLLTYLSRCVFIAMYR